MKRAFIFHGWGADNMSNWFPWLAGELQKKDFEVTAPNFPDTMNPKLDEWMKEVPIEKLQNAVLIGHSLGAPFIFRLLEKFVTENLEHMSGGEMIKPVHVNRAKAAFLVSSFDRSLGIPEIENFTEKPFDWKKIKNACEKFYVFHSDNDPYIPLWIGEEIAKKLDAELIVEKNGDHLNAPAGFLEYPKLLEKIMIST
jgi:predicted alpha/beta hydrolase family esterase